MRRWRARSVTITTGKGPSPCASCGRPMHEGWGGMGYAYGVHPVTKTRGSAGCVMVCKRQECLDDLNRLIDEKQERVFGHA